MIAPSEASPGVPKQNGAVSKEKSSPEPAASSSPVSAPPSPKETKAPIQVTLVKDKAGLGFSLDGGFDSPSGNKPLVIKKIFTGKSAFKSNFELYMQNFNILLLV